MALQSTVPSGFMKCKTCWMAQILHSTCLPLSIFLSQGYYLRSIHPPVSCIPAYSLILYYWGSFSWTTVRKGSICPWVNPHLKSLAPPHSQQKKNKQKLIDTQSKKEMETFIWAMLRNIAQEMVFQKALRTLPKRRVGRPGYTWFWWRSTSN